MFLHSRNLVKGINLCKQIAETHHFLGVFYICASYPEVLSSFKKDRKAVLNSECNTYYRKCLNIC